MNVELISHSENPVEVCERAASECYKAADPGRALMAAIESGHDSVLEHASFTFRICGISRVTLAQLTRHRLASYTVESQRYCNQEDSAVIVPETVMEKAHTAQEFKYAVNVCKKIYLLLIDMGIPKEDARYILPQGIETSLTLTMNARELRHFFRLRCCNRAQWEIRRLAHEMLTLVKSAAPGLFDGAGAPCVSGSCPESKPCGHPQGAIECPDCRSMKTQSIGHHFYFCRECGGIWERPKQEEDA